MQLMSRSFREVASGQRVLYDSTLVPESSAIVLRNRGGLVGSVRSSRSPPMPSAEFSSR